VFNLVCHIVGTSKAVDVEYNFEEDVSVYKGKGKGKILRQIAQ
jgi:hypothetical protein